MAERNARTLYGDTDDGSCVPDAPCYAQEPPSPAGKATPPPHGDCLADALAVWECFGDAPLRDAPLLLRFEHDDALVKASEGRLSIAWGAVDTSTPPHIERIAEASFPICPAWVPVEGLACILGEQVRGMSQTSASKCRLTLERCCVMLTAKGNEVRARIAGPKA